MQYHKYYSKKFQLSWNQFFKILHTQLRNFMSQSSLLALLSALSSKFPQQLIKLSIQSLFKLEAPKFSNFPSFSHKAFIRHKSHIFRSTTAMPCIPAINFCSFLLSVAVIYSRTKGTKRAKNLLHFTLYPSSVGNLSRCLKQKPHRKAAYQLFPTGFRSYFCHATQAHLSRECTTHNRLGSSESNSN